MSVDRNRPNAVHMLCPKWDCPFQTFRSPGNIGPCPRCASGLQVHSEWVEHKAERAAARHRAAFWSHVEKRGPTECWPWVSGGMDGDHRYGSFRTGGRKQQAHRIAYVWLRGEIPDGLVLDHLCRNTRCVNPAHLEPVPQRVNMLRGALPAFRAHLESLPIGHVFGERRVIAVEGRGPRGFLYRVRCRCGAESVSSASDLRQADTCPQCGAKKREAARRAARPSLGATHA